MPAGYSGTPLAKKLGIKEQFAVYVRNAPENYQDLVAPLPTGVTFKKRLTNDLDMIHFFSKEKKELAKYLPGYMDRIKRNGMIWVSWPKKASKVPTTITEDVIRELALPIGLVDIKVCAVDDIWSGLKLVIRKKLR